MIKNLLNLRYVQLFNRVGLIYGYIDPCLDLWSVHSIITVIIRGEKSLMCKNPDTIWIRSDANISQNLIK